MNFHNGFATYMQVEVYPFLAMTRAKARPYFNPDLAVLKLNVSSHYFHPILQFWKNESQVVLFNLMGYLGPFRMLPISYTTHAK